MPHDHRLAFGTRRGSRIGALKPQPLPSYCTVTRNFLFLPSSFPSFSLSYRAAGRGIVTPYSSSTSTRQHRRDFVVIFLNFAFLPFAPLLLCPLRQSPNAQKVPFPFLIYPRFLLFRSPPPTSFSCQSSITYFSPPLPVVSSLYS